MRRFLTMRRFLVGTGLVLTALYLWATLHLISGRWATLHTMELNELGDFFAGIFGPLAVLWLVLGFFQQGLELKLSTKALELQAEELRNSVNQQRELVSVTRQQVEAELEALRFEREARRAAAGPKLVFIGIGGTTSGDGRSHLKATFKNVGNTATLVTLQASPFLENLSPANFPSISRNDDVRFSFDCTRNRPLPHSILTFSFTDADGQFGEIAFDLVEKVSGGTLEFAARVNRLAPLLSGQHP